MAMTLEQASMNTATIRRLCTRWENRAGKALKDWVSFIMKHQGLTRAEARELVLRKLEARDGRIRRASVISFADGEFLTTSRWEATEKSSEFITTGKPHVQSDTDSVRVGCVRFTNEALQEISIIRWKQNKTSEPLIYQEGNYGVQE